MPKPDFEAVAWGHTWDHGGDRTKLAKLLERMYDRGRKDAATAGGMTHEDDYADRRVRNRKPNDSLPS